jgi:cell division protein FtsX
MLRSPNDALKANKFQSITAISVLAASLLIPCLTVLFAAFFADAATTYLSAYDPVVYLSAEVDDDKAAKLAEEFDGWATVGEARLRSPERAFEILRERVGEQEIARLGISPQMLPFSVVLEPALPLVGHVELITEVAGLPVRPEVATVDLPSADAARTLIFARRLMALGGVLLLLLLAVGVAQTRIFLARLEDQHARETTLLALFGAPPTWLRRSTLARGVTVGLWAGVASFAGLLLSLFLWQFARPAILGLSDASLGWAWLILVAPLILGPTAGFFAAGLVNRSRIKKKNIDELELQILL